MDQYLRDAGGMNPLAMGEPIRGLFWRLQVSFLAPKKAKKVYRNWSAGRWR